MIKYPFFILIIIFCIACSSQPQNHADICTDLSRSRTLKMSELFDSIRYLPLETTDTTLLAFAESIHINNGRYYLIYENTLFTFDEQGKCLFQTNRQGRGPDEYMRISKVKSSPDDSLVYVLGYQNRGNTVMTFDSNGKFLKTLIKTELFNQEFNVLEDCILTSDGYSVSIYDKQGHFEQNIHISPFDSINFATSNYLSGYSGQEAIFSCPGSDTLYFIGKKGITRKISLDYGYSRTPEEFKKSLKHQNSFPFFHHLIYLGQSLLDVVMIDNKQYLLQLDLHKREAIVCDTLINDIDNSLPYIPVGFTQKQGITVMPVSAFFHFLKPEQISAIPALCNLKEDDNPVIVILNLKAPDKIL